MHEETLTVEVTDDCSDHEAILKMFCPKDRALAREILGRGNPNAAKPRRKRFPREGQEDWIPLRRIFKTAKVPEAVGEMIEQAINLMKLNGDISDTNLWQSLEFAFAEYLSGADVDPPAEDAPELPENESGETAILASP
ncbi:MAG: hypothetical protein LAP85_24375 [Acidobacteriia bacterium]|nr:hypothetical protein [Terriglobia bacterium]